MERTIRELNDHFRETNAEPMTLWATVYYRRSATKRALRNIQPILVTLSREEQSRMRYSSHYFTIRNSNNEWVSIAGTAYGSEFHFFETMNEAIAYYNHKIDEAILSTDISIAALGKDKLRLQSLRISR